MRSERERRLGMTEKASRWRYTLVVAFVALSLGGQAIRLVMLQAWPDQIRIDSINRARQLVKDLSVERGTIVDCHGRVLAMDVFRKVVCADPVAVSSNPCLQDVAETLADPLNVSAPVLMRQLGSSRSRFVYPAGYGRTIDDDQACLIKEKGFQGVFFNDVLTRSYPLGVSMCHVLGYVNLKGQGSAGIELKLDDYLRGVPGLVVGEFDGRRREIYERRKLEVKARLGASVILTLDQYVQYLTEQALLRAIETHRAKAAWAIVQRVKTGEILAMASLPAYDLNRFREAEAESTRNRCIGLVYEPGSTFKISVIAAALNEGRVRPDQVFDCEGGVWMYQRRPLRDYHPYDKLSVADVLKKSSNIGAAKIGLALGPSLMHKYLLAFGFGEKTGVDLPGEEAGILHPLQDWIDISPTRVAMGHEVAVTALQMLNAMCTIANDGVRMRPYVVQRVLDRDGRLLVEQTPTVAARPIKPETARLMSRLLVRATEEGGTGTRARVSGYTVAGKTGTAQKIVDGRYSDSLNVASFVGVVPADDPELCIIVVVDEPRDLHTGGLVSAPVFREIAEEALRYLDVPPSDAVQVAQGARPLPGGRAGRALAALKETAADETQGLD